MNRSMTVSMSLVEALRLARVGAVASFPAAFHIPIAESLSAYCADKTSTIRFLNLNNERAAIAACTGAAAAGIRVFALACGGAVPLMNELASWTSAEECPLVIAETNRMTVPPWDIWANLRESAAAEKLGWIRLACENNQEVLDTVLQAYRLEERSGTPVTIVLDDPGYLYDHEPVEIPEQHKVDLFLAPPVSKKALPAGNGSARLRGTLRATPATVRLMLESFRNVETRYQKYFNRRYGMVEAFHCDKPEIILVSTGVTAHTVREVVRRLRAGGESVGLMKIKMLRPFPTVYVRRTLGPARKIAVIDRDISFGPRDLLARGVAASLEGVHNPPSVFNYVIGMGGSHITADMVEEIYAMTKKSISAREKSIWMCSPPQSIRDTA